MPVIKVKYATDYSLLCEDSTGILKASALLVGHTESVDLNSSGGIKQTIELSMADDGVSYMVTRLNTVTGRVLGQFVNADYNVVVAKYQELRGF